MTTELTRNKSLKDIWKIPKYLKLKQYTSKYLKDQKGIHQEN